MAQPSGVSLEDGEITEDETVVTAAASPIEKSVLVEFAIVDDPLSKPS